MNKNNNKKSQKTKSNIESIFLNLLKEKSINDITVSTLCSLANINRSSFYLHYSNVYDVMEQIEYKMINKLSKELNHTNNSTEYNSNRFILPYLDYIYTNKDFFTIFYKYSMNNKYESELESILFTDLKKHFNNSKVSNHIILNYCLEYYKSGLFSIIKKWILQDCKETPEEIEKIINICINNLPLRG